LSKDDNNLYKIIHLIDTDLIDAVLNYHRLFLEYRGIDDFSIIQNYIENLQRSLNFLLGDQGYPLTFSCLNKLQKEFYEKSGGYDKIITPEIYSKKSAILSFTFSYLIPESLRKQILKTLAFEISDYAVIYGVELSHQDLGEILSSIAQEQLKYFEQYLQASNSLIKITGQILVVTDNYCHLKNHHYPYLTPEIKNILNDVVSESDFLLHALRDKYEVLNLLKVEVNQLNKKINNFINEATRHAPLSSKSFFAGSKSDLTVGITPKLS
jgi:hypothetical protein